MAVCCTSWRGGKSPFPIKSNELYYSSAFRNAKASGLSREKQQTLHTWIHSNCDISNYQCNYYNLTISLQSRRPEPFKTNKKDTARNQFAHLKWRNSISPQLLPQIVVKYKFSKLFSNTLSSFHKNKSKLMNDTVFVLLFFNAVLWNSEFSGSLLPSKRVLRLLWKHSRISLTSWWRQEFCASHPHHL